jgi:two-component system, sensor histidine kinase
VLFNLCNNAMSWTDEGGIEIKTRLLSRRGDPGDVTLVTEISDSGPGMSKDALKLAFEPYARFAGADGKMSDGGTGLGLPIARSIIEAMGGTCTLESELGAGVVATITLPTKQMQSTPAGREGTKRRRALLAEDDAIARTVLISMLQALEFDVVAVPDGVDALAALKNAKFDVIVTDLRMPSMDGEALIELVRDRSQEGRGTPIIVVTAHALPGDEARLKAIGADALCQKPVETLDLAKALSLLKV